MPTLTRYFIKLGMVYFAIGLVLATLVLAQPVFNLSPRLVLLQPTYLHLLIVGWITQLIIGVAYWMFPKYSKEQPRGNERLGWAVLILLNAGIVLRSIGEPLHTMNPASIGGYLLAASAVCQLCGGWGFISMIWNRVKER